MNNNNGTFLLVTTQKNGKIPNWIGEIFKGLGVNRSQVETKVIPQTELTRTSIFVDTVKGYTGTTCVIINQTTKQSIKDAVQTGRKIIVFNNNSKRRMYTRYIDGKEIKTTRTTKTNTCAGVPA